MYASPPRRPAPWDDRGLSIGAVVLGLSGMVWLLGYGMSVAPAGSRLTTVCALALVAMSAAASAAVLGFLFGVPRTRASATPANGSRFDENTNLEQISDWLTKILVGVGLTQLEKIPGAFSAAAAAVAGGLPGVAVHPSVVGAVLLYFAMWGFLTSYIVTRIYMIALLEARRSEGEEDPTPTPVDAPEGAVAPAAAPAALATGTAPA